MKPNAHRNCKSEYVAFDAWLDLLDYELKEALMVGVKDIPDQNYRDIYDANMSFEEAAQEIVESLS